MVWTENTQFSYDLYKFGANRLHEPVKEEEEEDALEKDSGDEENLLMDVEEEDEEEEENANFGDVSKA